jgi:hypothetical protein
MAKSQSASSAAIGSLRSATVARAAVTGGRQGVSAGCGRRRETPAWVAGNAGRRCRARLHHFWKYGSELDSLTSNPNECNCPMIADWTERYSGASQRFGP